MNMAQSDETYQVKELLSGTFKFPDAPTSNKLMHLKDVHKWLFKIRQSFRKYANFYMFLYATVAYIDTSMELQPRKLKTKVKKEPNLVKKEVPSEDDSDGKYSTDEDEGSGKVSNVNVPEGLKTELARFGRITTYAELGEFMTTTKFSDKILTDNLLSTIAPFMAGKAQPPSANESLSKFKSLRYERRLNAPDKVGANQKYTKISEVGEYILPAEDRIKFGNGITFYYNGGAQESKLHSLLRPYIWSYLKQSLDKTPFSYVITECPILHDVSHVVQFLLKKAEAERVETDQCYEVLNTLNSLWMKDPKTPLQQWYAEAVEKSTAVNEVSATFGSKELFQIPTCFIETLFKVHAIREGHQDLLKRVARKNGGLVPLAKLQQELRLTEMAEGEIRSAESFSEKNESLFGGGKKSDRDDRTRRRGRVHATDGEEEGDINATQGGRGGKGGGRGKGKGGQAGGSTNNSPGQVSNDICYNYQSDKCAHGDECSRTHRKIDIPNDLCKNHLLWKSCKGPPGCTRTHTSWPEVIKRLNSDTPTRDTEGGEEPTKRGRSKTPRKKEKEASPPEKKASAGSDEKCDRCGKTGHLKAACYATFDAAGKELESEKPAPVPDAIKRRRAASKKQRDKSDKGEANAVAATPTEPDNGGFFLKITKNNKGGTAHVTEGISTCPPPTSMEN